MNQENSLRISLKFSEKDIDQIEVANLLKQKGRKKSAFITEAIIFYLQNKEEVLPEKVTIRTIVKEVLQEIEYEKYKKPQEPEKLSDTKNKASVSEKQISEKEQIEASYFDDSPKREVPKEKISKDEMIASVPDNELQDLLGSLDLFGD